MKRYERRFHLVMSACIVAYVVSSITAATANAAFTWTTAVNQTSGTTNQLRSVSVADQTGNDSVYVGYIQTSGNRQVDRHDTDSPYTELNTYTSGGSQPKGIATDDRGNVFVANRNSGVTQSHIQSFSSVLAPNANITPAEPATVGGIATQRVGSTYYAYTVYEANGLIQRFNVTNPNAMTLDLTFNVTGSYNIPGATDLRGIEVGADGSLYVASRGDSKVYKVSSDLSTVISANLTRAMDVAIFGGNVYATSYNGMTSMISVFSLANLNFVENITIAILDGNPYSRAATEGWSGIDIGSDGRIWLADQHYGSSGGTQDRLLVSSAIAQVPEPAMFVVLGVVALMAPFALRAAKKLSVTAS